MRAKMLDWLMEIIDAYQLTDETYFLTVHIMDEYFKTSN